MPYFMDKNYNYKRNKLMLAEYGRHIQEMAVGLRRIKDRNERNRQARAVIAVMGNLNPFLRDSDDFCHKLWDHLFIMAGFDLDVDSPYPRPTAATLDIKPQKMPYPQNNVRMKHYGKNVENILKSLAHSGNRHDTGQTLGNIARFMRTKSFEFNQEHPDNTVIIKDMKRLSDYGIEIDEAAIGNIRSEYRSNPQQYYRGGYRNNRPNNNTKGGKPFRKRTP